MPVENSLVWGWQKCVNSHAKIRLQLLYTHINPYEAPIYALQKYVLKL